MFVDFIRTRMFGRTGNEGFHCFLAEIWSLECCLEWVPGGMWKPYTWLWLLCVQIDNGFNRGPSCCAPGRASFLGFGSLPSGLTVRAPCQFLNGSALGLSPRCSPHSTRLSTQQCSQHKEPPLHISLCALTVAFHQNGRKWESRKCPSEP